MVIAVAVGSVVSNCRQERYTHRYIHIYIYIYMCIHIYVYQYHVYIYIYVVPPMIHAPSNVLTVNLRYFPLFCDSRILIVASRFCMIGKKQNTLNCL